MLYPYTFHQGSPIVGSEIANTWNGMQLGFNICKMFSYERQNVNLFVKFRYL